MLTFFLCLHTNNKKKQNKNKKIKITSVPACMTGDNPICKEIKSAATKPPAPQRAVSSALFGKQKKQKKKVKLLQKVQKRTNQIRK